MADLAWLDSGAALWLALLAIVATAAFSRDGVGRPAAAIVVFFALGVTALATQLEEAAHASLRRSFDATVEASVCGLRLRSHSVALELCRARAADPASGELPSRLLLEEALGGPGADWLRRRITGERVRLRLRLRPIVGLRNPGRSDPRRGLLRRGIGARATLVNDALVVRLPSRDTAPLGWHRLATLRRALADLRRELGDRLVASGPGGPLLRALAVGDRSLIGERSREDFQELGIAHLLAVSGLHLALVSALAYGVVRRLLVRFEAAARRFDLSGVALVLAACAATFYALLCGFEIPVRRALVFVWAIVLALLLGRRVPTTHVLALAGIAIFTFEPEAIFQAGAQLSFAATAALLTAREAVIAGRIGKRGGLTVAIDRLRSLLRSSALAVAATMPILAYHGGAVGTAALGSNLIAVPWTAAILLPSALLAAIFATGGDGPLASIVLAAAERIARVSLTGVEVAADLLPDLPPVAPPAGWVLFVAVVLSLGSLAASRTAPRVLLVLAVSLWLRLAPADVVSPPPPRVVALDVGQGDAVLVQGERGTLLVDGGRAIPGGLDLGRSVVLPALASLGVDEIDVVIASHADLDHSGGLLSVLGRLRVGELWLPAAGREDAGFAELIALAQAGGTRVVSIAASTRPRELGDLRVRPLWPPAVAPGASSNDRSLVVMVEVAGKRLLLTGDLGKSAERRLLEARADLRADILKVAHHGSATSSTDGFLAAVAADVALVSAACGGRMHLPNERVLRRIVEGGASLWWTGRDGALFVALRQGESPLVVSGWGSSRACLPPLSGEAPRSPRAAPERPVRRRPRC